MRVRFIDGECISKIGLNYINKTSEGGLQGAYGFYCIEAWGNIMFRKEINESLQDDTVYVVKQKRARDTLLTLLHELLHVLVMKCVPGIDRRYKLNKLIDKYLVHS